MPDSQRQGPTFLRRPGYEVGRDGCRTCLPWEAEGRTWVSVPARRSRQGGSGKEPAEYQQCAADVQDKNPKSVLNLYRKAIALRREFQSARTSSGFPTTTTRLSTLSVPTAGRCLSTLAQTPSRFPPAVWFYP